MMTDIARISVDSPRDDATFDAGKFDIHQAFQAVAEAAENTPSAALARINHTVAGLLFGRPQTGVDSVSGWAWPRPPEAIAASPGAPTATLVGDRLTLQGRQRFRPAHSAGNGVLLLTADADPDKGGYIVLLDRAQIQAGGPIFQRDGFQNDEIVVSEPLKTTALSILGAHALRQRLELATLIEELLHAALDGGILRGFLAAAHTHITTRTRPWQGQSLAKATDDPHLVRRYGEYIATGHALEELLAEALEAVARASPQALKALANPAGPAAPESALGQTAPGVPESALAQAAPSVPESALVQAWDAVAAARIFALLAGRTIINGVIELLGASATSQRFGFDGYWRDFTAHAVAYPPYRPVERIGRDLLNTNPREADV